MQINETTVRVRYADTDAMGVVYHGHYFTWFEVGRTETLRALGLAYREVEALGFYLPVVDCSARFLAPARYDDLLVIETQIERLDRLRVGFAYAIRHAETGQRLVTGETAHVFVNRDGRPQRLPLESDLWRRLASVRQTLGLAPP